MSIIPIEWFGVEAMYCKKNFNDINIFQINCNFVWYTLWRLIRKKSSEEWAEYDLKRKKILAGMQAAWFLSLHRWDD